MPTPGGLPKPGEVWTRTYTLPHNEGGRQVWKKYTQIFRVIERSRGEYFSLRVNVLVEDGKWVADDRMAQRKLWVDAAYYFGNGELKYTPYKDELLNEWARRGHTGDLQLTEQEMSHKLVIEIDTGNASFGDDRDAALAMLLRRVAHRIESDGLAVGDEDPILDSDGNNVGRYSYGR